MPRIDLSKHTIVTYRLLRIGLVVIGIAFPLVLGFGGYILDKLPLQGSMSAYYHASRYSEKHYMESKSQFDAEHPKPTNKQLSDWDKSAYTHNSEGVMRNWFVGILFVVGVILFLYKGFTPAEDRALNLAGAFALGVAVFPMSWGEGFEGIEFPVMKVSLHGACAVLLFLCIAYVSIFRSADTLSLISNERRRERYRKLYIVLGWVMVASPLTAFVLVSFFAFPRSYTFFVELVGIWVFASYWWCKSREIEETQADMKALRGQLHADIHKAPNGRSKVTMTSTPP